MPKVVDRDTRTVMVLVNETERMRNAAERVALVVQAIALRRGVRCNTDSATGEDDLFEPG